MTPRAPRAALKRLSESLDALRACVVVLGEVLFSLDPARMVGVLIGEVLLDRIKKSGSLARDGKENRKRLISFHGPLM